MTSFTAAVPGDTCKVLLSHPANKVWGCKLANFNYVALFKTEVTKGVSGERPRKENKDNMQNNGSHKTEHKAFKCSVAATWHWEVSSVQDTQTAASGLLFNGHTEDVKQLLKKLFRHCTCNNPCSMECVLDDTLFSVSHIFCAVFMVESEPRST